MYIVACNYTYIAPLLLLFLVPLHYQYLREQQWCFSADFVSYQSSTQIDLLRCDHTWLAGKSTNEMAVEMRRSSSIPYLSLMSEG